MLDAYVRLPSLSDYVGLAVTKAHILGSRVKGNSQAWFCSDCGAGDSPIDHDPGCFPSFSQDRLECTGNGVGRDLSEMEPYPRFELHLCTLIVSICELEFVRGSVKT